jgi:hypothetical protein
LGILYRISMEVKKQHIIQELLSKGISQNRDGKYVYDLDYYELKHELGLAVFREKDIENDQNKWF